MADSAPTTSVILLARLVSGIDPNAWDQFVYRYGPAVVKWCRGYGLQEVDVQDVTQDVLVTVFRQIQNFQYDPAKRFRGWLRMVVHASWCDWVERRRPWNQALGGDDTRRLQEISAGEELVALIERQHEQERLEYATLRVSERVARQTWDAFRLNVLEGLSGQDTADLLGIKVGSVFTAKSRVIGLIREEVEKLDEVL